MEEREKERKRIRKSMMNRRTFLKTVSGTIGAICTLAVSKVCGVVHTPKIVEPLTFKESDSHSRFIYPVYWNLIFDFLVPCIEDMTNSGYFQLVTSKSKTFQYKKDNIVLVRYKIDENPAARCFSIHLPIEQLKKYIRVEYVQPKGGTDKITFYSCLSTEPLTKKKMAERERDEYG